MNRTNLCSSWRRWPHNCLKIQPTHRFVGSQDFKPRQPLFIFVVFPTTRILFAVRIYPHTSVRQGFGDSHIRRRTKKFSEWYKGCMLALRSPCVCEPATAWRACDQSGLYFKSCRISSCKHRFTPKVFAKVLQSSKCRKPGHHHVTCMAMALFMIIALPDYHFIHSVGLHGRCPCVRSRNSNHIRSRVKQQHPHGFG